MTQSMLNVQNVYCGYGDLTVIRDANFEVPSSSVTSVLGRNGAGKTTILRAIAGLIPLQSGDIDFQGRSLKNIPPYSRRRLGFGYVQENKRVFKQRTVAENLVLGLHGLKLSRRELAERMDESYDRFPALAERRNAPAGFLSGGQQQMLAIAQALQSQPTLLMLDEPSTGLAPSIVEEVLKIIKELRNESGMTVLLIEQSIEVALRIADWVVLLDVGRTAYSASTDTPGIQELIESVYMATGKEL